MAQQTSPFLEGKYGWGLGESNWNLGMDENLLKFSFMFDKNVDDIVSSLPAPLSGTSYYLTTDNRVYFAVNNLSWYSAPVPVWFILTKRSTGEFYQFNGTSLVNIESNTELDTRVDSLEANSATAQAIPRKVANFTALRALSKTLDPKIIYLEGLGFYALDATDTTSTDNGGMLIVGTDGGRWKFLSNSTTSNQYYQEYGAVNHRVGDRSFLGDAVKNNGKNETTQADWMTTFQLAHGRTNGFIQSTQVSALTSAAPDASNCLLVGARTSTLYDNYNAIGIISIAVADKTTGTGYAYASYLEAYRMSGALGGAYGEEIDTINFASYVAIDPYNQLASQTVGHQMAAGGEISPVGQFDASAAYNIQNNGAKFGIGINFGATAITGTDGVSGTGIVAAMAKGHMYQWYAGGVKTSSILGNCATPSLSLNQVFVDNQFQVTNQAAKTVFRVFAAASSVNYLDLRSSIAGAAVAIAAGGDDTNIDVGLTPKGSGLVAYGTYTTGVVTQAGYIQIRDSGGTVRRLLVG